MLIAVAEEYLALKFIVQDLPKTRTNIEGKVPKHLRDHVELTAHECFTPRPELSDLCFAAGCQGHFNDLVLPTPVSLPQIVEKSIRTTAVMVQSLLQLYRKGA